MVSSRGWGRFVWGRSLSEAAFEPGETGVDDSYLLGETPEGAGVLVPEGVDLALHACQAFGEGAAVALGLHPAAHRPQLPPHGDQAGEGRQDAGDGGENRSDVLHYWTPPPVDGAAGAGAGAGSWATWAAAAAAGSSLGSGAGDGAAGASASGSASGADWPAESLP